MSTSGRRPRLEGKTEGGPMSPAKEGEAPPGASGGRKEPGRSRRSPAKGGSKTNASKGARAKGSGGTTGRKSARSGKASGGKGRAAGSGPAGKKAETSRSTRRKPMAVTVPHELVVRRILDARKTTLVVFFMRALGGLLVTLILSVVIAFIITLPLAGFGANAASSLVAVAVAAGLVFAGYMTSGPVPGEAPFLADTVFIWLDPFREQRPRYMPLWLEGVLWGPHQLLAGTVPFLRLRATSRTEAEAAASTARDVAEAGDLDIPKSLPPEGTRGKGLVMLLMLRFVCLGADGDRITALMTGLGQSALFESTVISGRLG